MGTGGCSLPGCPLRTRRFPLSERPPTAGTPRPFAASTSGGGDAAVAGGGGASISGGGDFSMAGGGGASVASEGGDSMGTGGCSLPGCPLRTRRLPLSDRPPAAGTPRLVEAFIAHAEKEALVSWARGRRHLCSTRCLATHAPFCRDHITEDYGGSRISIRDYQIIGTNSGLDD